MNNPYLLKKQIKDNEEELSNYLRDMSIWQEQMKRKEISPPNIDENKKTKIDSSKTELNKKPWDYSACNKFDADNACKELDLQNESKKNVRQSTTDDRLKNQQADGLYEKSLGNGLVQKQKWPEAIQRYTRAIEYYDKDPVFYANRALCYLKTNEFQKAISDCNSSLKLDNNYVKAYQRRSAAYMALGKYNEAKIDLNKILKLEPNNKQAKLDIEVVNNKTKQGAVKIKSNIKCQKTDFINQQQAKNNSSNILCKDIEKPIKNVVPNWLPRVGCKQITTKQKPPHLRSKKPLYTPKIRDVQVDTEDFDDMYLLQTTLKEVCGESNKFKENKGTISAKNNLISTEKTHSLVVPPSPLTYVQLKQDWAYLKTDSKLLCQYLKQIPGKSLPSIVCNSMDNDLFVDILRILKSEFIQNNYEIKDYLVGISKLPRLQMLVMFCTDSEVACIKELLNHVSKLLSENEFKNIKKSFGV